jgi:hypothetical protein
MKKEHTPTPWQVQRHRGLPDFAIATPDVNAYEIYNRIATVHAPASDDLYEQAEVNAAFIVKAVNSHEALVRELRWCIAVLENKTLNEQEAVVLKDAQAALKLAEAE